MTKDTKRRINATPAIIVAIVVALRYHRLYNIGVVREIIAGVIIFVDAE